MLQVFGLISVVVLALLTLAGCDNAPPSGRPAGDSAQLSGGQADALNDAELSEARATAISYALTPEPTATAGLSPAIEAMPSFTVASTEEPDAATATALPPTPTQAERTATALSTATPTLTLTPVPADTATPTPVPTAPNADEITRVAPGQGEIALVFTADAFRGEIPTILDTLQAHKAHITFFLTGTYLNAYPDEARAIDAAGHEIASHGYDHIDYRQLTSEQVIGRLDHWQQTFKDLTGKAGPHYWMAPSGYSNIRIRQAAFEHGYTTIYWTMDVLDAVGNPKSKAFVLNRVLNTSINLDGSIILMHVDKKGTIQALPAILDALEQRGLHAVTVSELLRR